MRHISSEGIMLQSALAKTAPSGRVPLLTRTNLALRICKHRCCSHKPTFKQGKGRSRICSFVGRSGGSVSPRSNLKL